MELSDGQYKALVEAVGQKQADAIKARLRFQQWDASGERGISSASLDEVRVRIDDMVRERRVTLAQIEALPSSPASQALIADLNNQIQQLTVLAAEVDRQAQVIASQFDNDLSAFSARKSVVHRLMTFSTQSRKSDKASGGIAGQIMRGEW